MKADKIPVELPDNPLPYLTDWLMEIGPLASGGMGPAALGWGEIASWQSLTCNALTGWEARTLRHLSRQFLDQMNKSREPGCPAPFSTGAINNDAVNDQFKKMFRFAQAAKRPEQG